jgi:hypothetical protein
VPPCPKFSSLLPQGFLEAVELDDIQSSNLNAENEESSKPTWNFAWHDKCQSVIFSMTTYVVTKVVKNIVLINYVFKKFNTTPRETQAGTVKCERHTCRLICNDADMIIEGREKVTCKFIGSNKRLVWSGKLG